MYRIYRISTEDNTKHYIGSTKKTLNARLNLHICNNKRFKEGKQKKSCSSYQILDTPNYTITLLEEGSCWKKDWNKYRERFWIDQYRIRGGCVNITTPTRSYNQLRASNRQVYRNKFKKYYYSNLEESRERAKIRQRKYLEKHREEINRRRREARKLKKSGM